jgi:hypothetical protein
MEANDNNTQKQTWFKRLGWAGILFFTVKGCISLGLMIWAGKCALD